MKTIARVRTALLVLALTFASATLAADAKSTTLDLNQYEGKVVVLDFWASWCVPCRRSFPWLDEMQSKYGRDGLVVIGVNLDASQEDATKFLGEFPTTFRIHFDKEAALATEYGVEAMPSSFVIGRDGEIKARHDGFRVKQQAEYEAILVEALGDQL